MFVDELTVKAWEVSPLNLTAVAPVRFVPLIVTCFSVGPLVGVKLEIVGVPGDPFASCTALSARMKPKPQSLSGLPASVQSIALTGLVMIAPSWSGVREGLACLTRAATPAALGVAALVPQNGAKPGTVVLTQSAAASCGFWRVCWAAGSGLPFLSNSRLFGPRELYDSGSLCPGSAASIAATEYAPTADAASGLIAWELVPCWML